MASGCETFVPAVTAALVINVLHAGGYSDEDHLGAEVQQQSRLLGATLHKYICSKTDACKKEMFLS